MRAAGIEFPEFPQRPEATYRDGVMDIGRMRAIWFKDSEGNLLSIAEFAQGSPFRST